MQKDVTQHRRNNVAIIDLLRSISRNFVQFIEVLIKIGDIPLRRYLVNSDQLILAQYLGILHKDIKVVYTLFCSLF